TAIAVLHYNENSNRKQAKTKNDVDRCALKLPKARKGEWVVSHIMEPASYDYVHKLLSCCLGMTEAVRTYKEAAATYVPPSRSRPLCSVSQRPDKEAAVLAHRTRYACPLLSPLVQLRMPCPLLLLLSLIYCCPPKVTVSLDPTAATMSRLGSEQTETSHSNASSSAEAVAISPLQTSAAWRKVTATAVTIFPKYLSKFQNLIDDYFSRELGVNTTV
ncbi:hypothetical protein HPB47_000331, partial [Ixodes persulcatus]